MKTRRLIVDDLYVRLPVQDYLDKESFLHDSFSLEYEEEEPFTNSRGEQDIRIVKKTKFYLWVEEDNYTLHSGMVRRVFFILQEAGIPLSAMQVTDLRDKTKPRVLDYEIDPRVTEEFSLRPDYQTPVVKSMLELRKGIIFVPTRGGKTEMLINIVQNYQNYENRKCKVTIIVRKAGLAKNISDRFKSRGFDSVGDFYDGKKDYFKDVLVCIINSVFNVITKEETLAKLRREDSRVYARLMSSDIIIVDEIQDGSADMFQYVIPRILKVNHPDLLITCSGTPYLREFDIHSNIRDMNITQHFGSVVMRVSDEYLIEKGYKARGNVIWLDYKMYPETFKTRAYPLIYKKFIVDNFARNSVAANCVGHIVNAGKSCLVLVNRIPHGNSFLSMLSGYSSTKRCVFTSAEITYELRGKTVHKVTIKDPIAEFNAGKIDVLIGTNILNVGIDFPNCQWLILLAGEGNDNDILNKQRTSRVLCPQIQDNNGYIIDFIDIHNTITMKHSRSRKDLYEAANYNQYSDSQKVLEFLKRQ